MKTSIINIEKIGICLGLAQPNQVGTVSAIMQDGIVGVHLVSVPATLVPKISEIFKLLEIRAVGVVVTPEDFTEAVTKPVEEIKAEDTVVLSDDAAQVGNA